MVQQCRGEEAREVAHLGGVLWDEGAAVSPPDEAALPAEDELGHVRLP